MAGKWKFVEMRKARSLAPKGRGWECLGITLPASAVRALGWKDGDQVEVWIAEGMDFLVLKRRKLGGETGASKAVADQKGRTGAP
jgi:hypothetical protein